MEATDRIEALLEDGGLDRLRRDHLDGLVASVVDACEFAAIRWGYWILHGQDLLSSFPADPGSFLGRALARRTGVALLDLVEHGHEQLQSTVLDGLHLCEIPRDGSDWEPGGRVALFEESLKDALVQAGHSTAFAHALAGAFDEMASNASEHADAPIPPLAAFSVRGTAWGFAVVDVGRGARSSLAKNPDFSALSSDLDALRSAVQPGISSKREPGRGNGFRHIFKALADRSCRLRIRSGAALARWSGSTPTHQNLGWRKAIPRPGFQLGIRNAA